MKFIDLVRQRRSVRDYRQDKIPSELIDRCIDAARYAPTACNTQCCRFIVAEGDLKHRIVEECLGELPVKNSWAVKAPVIVILTTRKNFVTHRVAAGLKGIPYNMIDAGISGDHFILQATELGLGTCWLGWFKKKKLARILGLPAGREIAGLITVGYPASVPEAPDKKRLDEVREFRDGS